jgi:alpha-L-fucosidase
MNRRTFVHTGAGALAAGLINVRMPRRMSMARPVPSPSQLAWQRDEMAMFLHFGVNTFTDREWGDGKEDPKIFNPTQLDARQWAKTARAAGFRAMILTAKHHDGFCLWQTKTTDHSVAASPFRGGKGDVVREFVDACAAEGLKAGLYLSPWDRNSAFYGDSARYNDLYADQLAELLTRYGKIDEVWFDGANGEGPNGKRQQYDWPRVFAHVRRLQPDAVIFSDAGLDVRWCGNENGTAGDPNWSTVNPATVTFPGQTGDGIADALQHGDPAGSVWRPAECDTSIRKGWFYHPAEDDTVRSGQNLFDLYFKSVGQNGKLLLNVPPTTAGLLHPTDIAHLGAFNDRMLKFREGELFAADRPGWRTTGPTSGEATLDLGKPTNVSVARLSEDIVRGQTVAKYTLYGADEGPWAVLSRGTTIGYAKLDRFPTTRVRWLKVVVEDAAASPLPIGIAMYSDG